MLESEAGRAHIKGIIDKYLLEADINPYEKDTARLVEASSKAIQEILREYTKSVLGSLGERPWGPGE